MNYTEAVALAKAGNERGFGFLYETTYKSKYYLALQYMKNEEAAKDVLQDAYCKAFDRLDTLAEPEAFPGWLGRIVANTAKNALAKRNPVLFSEMGTEDEDGTFEYRIEDDKIENQPELSYTRQETQELVRQLIDSLSDEQRICILMFHIENVPINEIAATLGCSENTVKSRLNYGRKNLRKKAEELKKKGYKLYNVAPLPLFLYLLRSQEGYLAADGALTAAGKSVAATVFQSMSQAGTGGAGGAAGGQAALGSQTASGAQAAAKAATAAKTGLLHTTLGKVAAVTVGVCLAGGAGFYGASQIMDHREEPPAVQEEQEEPPQQETEEQQEPEQEAEETPVEVRDEEYPELIAGNLTKEELEYVLAYGPQEIPAQGFSESDLEQILNALCDASSRSGGMIEEYEPDASWRSRYSVEDINRMFASFSDHQFAEENDEDGAEYGVNVDGQVLTYVPATLSYVCQAQITSAEYTEKEMELYYTYDFRGESRQETLQKKAVLTPNEEGLYQIVSIEDVGTAGQDTSEFPVGSYSYVAPVGGLRTSLTIEASGTATIVELMSGTGETSTTIYQISVDNAVASGGMTRYILKPVDGGDDRILTYDEEQNVLHDVTAGFDWTA